MRVLGIRKVMKWLISPSENVVNPCYARDTRIHNTQEMSLVETLIVTIGSEMGKSLLKIWLKEQPLLEAAGTSSIDLLKSKTADVLSARRAAREFETLGDRMKFLLQFLTQKFLVNYWQSLVITRSDFLNISKVNIQMVMHFSLKLRQVYTIVFLTFLHSTLLIWHPTCQVIQKLLLSA
jgi:hypothetical protein